MFSLYSDYIENIFSQAKAYLFTFVIVSFEKQKISIFMGSNLPIFLLYDPLF